MKIGERIGLIRKDKKIERFERLGERKGNLGLFEFKNKKISF